MKKLTLILTCILISCTNPKKNFESKLQNDAFDIEAKFMAEMIVPNDKYDLTTEEIKTISSTIIKFEEENYNKGDNYLWKWQMYFKLGDKLFKKPDTLNLDTFLNFRMNPDTMILKDKYKIFYKN